MPEIRICLTTVGKRADAERLARRLVQGRLAACVNVVPGLVSHYRWKGRTRRDAEFLLVMKTTAAGAKALEREIAKIHPYELPEFVAFPAKGSARYLAWIGENTGRSR